MHFKPYQWPLNKNVENRPKEIKIKELFERSEFSLIISAGLIFRELVEESWIFGFFFFKKKESVASRREKALLLKKEERRKKKEENEI